MLKDEVTSIAIGGFDGMHLAHQELFSHLDSNGAILVIESGYANLTPKEYRSLYSKYPLYYYSLDDIKHLEALEFITLLENEYPNLKKIIVGFDFKFGAKASGNITTLKHNFNGELIVIDEVCYNNEAIHSRLIREYINKDDLKTAALYLGKNYSVYGNLVEGQGLGKKQFFSTMNLDIKDFLIPNEGVYASYTLLNGMKYLSATFIGHRLTTDGKYAVETHIIDKELNVNKGEIGIEFIAKIRNNRKFEDFKLLKKQISFDINQIKSNFR